MSIASLCEAPTGAYFRLGPVLADPDLDGQWRVEVVGADHLRPDELANVFDLGVRDLEQELVVHLEDEPSPGVPRPVAAGGCGSSRP